jgi:hypothetical protein
VQHLAVQPGCARNLKLADIAMAEQVGVQFVGDTQTQVWASSRAAPGVLTRNVRSSIWAQ